MTNHPLTLNEIENIKVLKANGLSYYAVAKRVGRDFKTVKRCCQDPRNAEDIKIIQQELAGYFEDLSMRFITSISDTDIEKLNGLQRVTSAAICVDKLRLLRGESTENISMQTLTGELEDLNKKEIALEKRIREISGNNTETRQKNRKELEDKTHNPEENDEN